MMDVPYGYDPFAQVRYVRFSVDFRVIDQGANDHAQITCGDASAVSAEGQLIDGIEMPSGRFLSLERNLWLLDGSYMPIDQGESEQIGWWSQDVCGDDGVFTDPPYVRFDFSQDVTSIGFTLFFDVDGGCPPDTVRTTVYAHDNSVMADSTVTCGSAVLVIDLPCERYRAVRFSFPYMGFPHRRVRMTECVFGVVKSYDPDNLASAKLTYGADIACDKFVTSQLEMTVDNADSAYNMRNPASIYAFLQDGQEIRTYISIGGVRTDMGKFRFTSAKAKDGGITAQIKANDRAYGLDGIQYVPWASYGSVVALSEAVDEVLYTYGIPVQYGEGIGERKVRLSPPSGSSLREVLRLLAQAARCSIWFDRSGVLRFCAFSVSADPVQSYTEDQLYSMDNISVSEKIFVIRLDATMEAVGNTSPTEEVYTYGTGDTEKRVQNPCVAPECGDDVARWLYDMYSLRVRYSYKNRCDPSVEIGDTVSIADVFGDPGRSIVTEVSISYNGGLSATNKGVSYD